MKTVCIYLHWFWSYESLNFVFFYCFICWLAKNAYHNIKTMDEQNFCKPVVSKRNVIDIWCQYWNLMSSFRLLHPFWISVLNFYDDVTLNSALCALSFYEAQSSMNSSQVGYDLLQNCPGKDIFLSFGLFVVATFIALYPKNV